jgi:hypothetical protein
MKVEKNSQIINPFGGINFIVDAIKRSGTLDIIDNQLGERPAQATYSYSDLILNLWSVFFCGGECAEDNNEHLKNHLKNVPGLKVSDADTILRVMKSLKTEKEQVIGPTGAVYQTNRNDKLNQMNIDILKHLGLLKAGGYYNFDYDNEVLKTEKYDTKKTYKMVNGYFPGMATIQGMPVYFENKDGNMNVKTDQDELLERCFTMLLACNILIDKARMDAGSYTKRIVKVVERFCKKFYIRANRCEHLTNELLQNRNWEKVEINNIVYEVCSIEYQPFGYDKGEEKTSYRLVVSREKTDEKQIDLLTGDTMKYRSILTNDRESSDKDVIEYYNKRGTEEKTIDILNNDFGWSKMPFSFMEENTVFLMVMMICKNIYTWLIGKFAKVFSTLKENFRIKKFIFRFVTVPVKWIKRGRQMIIKVFSDKPYELLIN